MAGFPIPISIFLVGSVGEGLKWENHTRQRILLPCHESRQILAAPKTLGRLHELHLSGIWEDFYEFVGVSKDQSHHSAPKRYEARFRVRIFNPFPFPFGETLWLFGCCVSFWNGIFNPWVHPELTKRGNCKGNLDLCLVMITGLFFPFFPWIYQGKKCLITMAAEHAQFWEGLFCSGPCAQASFNLWIWFRLAAIREWTFIS